MENRAERRYVSGRYKDTRFCVSMHGTRKEVEEEITRLIVKKYIKAIREEYRTKLIEFEEQDHPFS